MKKLYRKLFAFFSLLLLFSCHNDLPIAPSCITIDDISNNFGQTLVEINSSKKTPFKIINECNININVTELDVDNTATEFLIEGLRKNSVITKDGLNFNVVFSPKTKGQKTFKFSIKTIEATIYMNLGAKGI